MKNRHKGLSMIPERIPPAQLPLPFQPSPLVQMTQDDRTATLSALAQLLLSAAGARADEASDEH